MQQSLAQGLSVLMALCAQWYEAGAHHKGLAALATVSSGEDDTQ